MIIEDNRKNIDVEFGSLKSGDFFEYEGKFFIKILSDNQIEESVGLYGDYKSRWFHPNTMVTKLNAKLVIE